MEFIRAHAGHRQPKDDGGLVWGVEPICTVLSEHGLRSPRRPTTPTSASRRPVVSVETRCC